MYKNKFKALKEAASEYYKKKDYPNGLASLQKAFELAPNEVELGDKYNIACFYSLIEDKENAFRYLNMIIDMKYGNYKYIKKDEDFVNLYSDKRWEAILAKVKKNEELASKK